MAKERENSDLSLPSSQSKRPAFSQRDSDSQISDNALSQQQHHQPRAKHQKHVVGGGSGRLHARVPSSKALHKHNASTSTVKLTRRQTSPSPVERALASSSHRRATSEVKLPSRESSSMNLKKNSSQTSLKRNRSHVEVGKRNKSSGHLKRSSSNPTVNKTKSSKSQVHFDLGNDGQEDEWVDASTSASPYLSRRGSVNSTAQSSSQAQSALDSRSQSPLREPDQEAASSGPEGSDTDRERAQHREYLTSRLLQRTPSHGAPPKMSAEVASVEPIRSQRQQSPDSGLSRESSTLSGTPSTGAHPALGSNGNDELTSRFVTTSSQGSGAAGSFYTGGSSSIPSTGRTDDGSHRSRSMGNLARSSETNRSTPTQKELEGLKDKATPVGDEDDVGITSSALASTARSRRTGIVVAPPAEKSRTQQKINLQRASSSMEPSHRHHSGMGRLAAIQHAAGPLVGGAGYDESDPRVNKLLERTGLEYLIVRRYQNPVARSLARLKQLPGYDKGQRIPAGGGAPNGHSKRNSTLSGGGQYGLSQSYRDRDSQPSRRPVTPRRNFSSIRADGADSSLDTDDGAARGHDGLSGSSLVNGEDDDGTLALLRALWEKNLDLSASQD